MTAVDVDALDKLREAIRDVLAGWSLGAGYYQYTVGTDDAREMADALLADALPDLIAEVRRGRALREALEGLATELDKKPHAVSPIVPRVDISRRLRAVLAAVDGGWRR